MRTRIPALAAALLLGACQLGAQEAPRPLPRYHAAVGVAGAGSERRGIGLALRVGASHPLNRHLVLAADVEYQGYGKDDRVEITAPCPPGEICGFGEPYDGSLHLLGLSTELVIREQAIPTFYLFGGGGLAAGLNRGGTTRPQLTAGVGWEFHLGATPTTLEFRARTYPGAKWPMEKETFPVTVGFRF